MSRYAVVAVAGQLSYYLRLVLKVSVHRLVDVHRGSWRGCPIVQLAYNCLRWQRVPVRSFQSLLPLLSTPTPRSYTMDPASAIIGIVSFGFTVFSKVNNVRKIIKGGPQQLQSLEDSCSTVLLFLNRLRDAEAPGSLHPDATHIVALCETARRALDDVKTIMDNVAVRGSASAWDSAAGRRSIRKFKLLRKNDDIINIARKLKELESTLASIAILVRL